MISAPNSPKTNEQLLELLSMQHQAWLDHPITQMLLSELRNKASLVHQAVLAVSRTQDNFALIAQRLEQEQQRNTLVDYVIRGPKQWPGAGDKSQSRA